MTSRCRFVATLAAALAFASVAARATADVTRVEIASRTPVGQFGYEKIVGTIYFAVDPADARNRIIVDIDKAPRNAAGLVEFSADLVILRPTDAARANGVTLMEIPNRGRRGLIGGFDRGPAIDPASAAEVGDGFLLKRGYTLVWVGWEIDVPNQPGLLRLHAPSATDHGTPITGLVRAAFTPSSHASDFTVGDLAAYAPVDAAGSDSTLVRLGDDGRPETLERSKWRLSGDVVTLDGGFEPGATYEIAYRAANPPVSGLGFASTRDTAAWIKHASDALVSTRYVDVFGSSQCGRYLRDFLYLGFNSDTRGRQVFDGVLAHIAGAARTNVNTRWAAPVTLAMYTATSFPFADEAMRDPITGATDGLLDNPRARANQPKIFYTNTGVEYWGGGRSAALLHTTPDGTKDIALPANVRVYFLAGTQHGPGKFPPTLGPGQQPDNPTDYWWAMRALLTAMDRWVREGAAPPPSRYPRLADGTLVAADRVAFPALPHVASPRTLKPGVRMPNPLLAREGAAGTPLPYLVPQVDADGNERAGIRLPEIAVPLATYTGWNFRTPSTGAPDKLVPLVGSYIAFARTAAARSASNDPRPSIAERYATRDAYLARVSDAAKGLVRDGLLLEEDVPIVVSHAATHWDYATRAVTSDR